MSSELERLLRQARESLPGPDEAATRRARERALAGLRGRRRFRRRSALALGAALLAAIGVGVGIGALVVPSGSAAPAPVGLGFLPERGWEVAQNGGDGTPLRPALAVAANVPLSPDDDPDGLPYSTLLTLPPNGVVIVVEFTSLGEHLGSSTLVPVRKLPLRVRDAVPHIEWSAQVRPERPLGQYQLRAAVKGYAVDVQIYFGTRRPSPALLASAQRQLDRLVVAPQRVTMLAQPTVVRWFERVQLFGSVASGQAGQRVAIQVKQCGQRSFRTATSTETAEGGGWSAETYVQVNSVFRATWNDNTSGEVRVWQRPGVVLTQLTATRFKISVQALRYLPGKRVVLQRYVRPSGPWTNVRSVVLTDARGGGLTSTTFRAVLPKGTLVRAVFPLSQARPCYLAGYSHMLRT